MIASGPTAAFLDSLSKNIDEVTAPVLNQLAVDSVVTGARNENLLTEFQLAEELGEERTPRPSRDASYTIAWWRSRQVLVAFFTPAHEAPLLGYSGQKAESQGFKWGESCEYICVCCQREDRRASEGSWLLHHFGPQSSRHLSVHLHCRLILRVFQQKGLQLFND